MARNHRDTIGGMRLVSDTVMTTEGEYPREVWERIQRERAEQQKPFTMQKAAPAQKLCPLSRMQACSADKCALYHDGCTFSATAPASDSKPQIGKRCPIDIEHKACTDRCALFNRGCAVK